MFTRIATATHEELKLLGHERGFNVASWVEWVWPGDTVFWPDTHKKVTIDDTAMAVEYLEACAFACESNDRDFSPFESTASALNARDDAEEAWATYDAGIAAGIAANLAQRMGALARNAA